MVDRVLNNISSQSRRILDLQEQLATGQRVNRPSDDSLAARRGVAARSEMTRNEQYLTNINSASPHLLESETSILTIVDNLRRAYELTLTGANGTNSQTQRDQIAIEVNQILEGILVESNHVTNGRYIFGGTRSLEKPFVATRAAGGDITAVSYEGNDDKIKVAISDGITVDINETGRDVFTQNGPNTVDVFDMLINIRDNLRSGNIDFLQDRLGELDLAQDQLLVSTARVGAIQNRMDRVDANTRLTNTQLELVLSDNIDADFADVMVNLNAQENAFQASLSAGARVIQPSLLDFIR
jgi:flagellar hook-associated protein 3 FlgL